jgi:hypothetical protein
VLFVGEPFEASTPVLALLDLEPNQLSCSLSRLPHEDLVQPVEFDLVFEARIIDLAVCLAAFR